MTPKDGFLRVGAMFTEAEAKYLEEVLGLDPKVYRRAQAASPAIPFSVFLPEALSESEQTLLAKILGSVNLAQIPIAVAQYPENALEVLSFSSDGRVERCVQDEVLLWQFPRVGLMLGAGPSVAKLKKETWDLLKLFQAQVR